MFCLLVLFTVCPRARALSLSLSFSVSQTCNFIWQGHSNVAICMSVLLCMDALSVNFAEAMSCSWAGGTKVVKVKRASLKESGPNWIYIFHHEIPFIVLKLLSKQTSLEHIHSELWDNQWRSAVSFCIIFLSSTRERDLCFVHSSFPRA